jgi:Ca2+-binding EF-hand superfamily protein
MRRLAAIIAVCLAAVAAAAPAFAEKPPRDPEFERLDLNRDGSIAFEEFVRVSDQRLAGMDRNRDGAIGREEFMAHHLADARLRLGRLFQRLDRDRDGAIPLARMSKPSRDKLLRYDANRDGRVTREEFLDWERREAERWQRRLFQAMDANRDGAISREERLADLRRRFRTLDANGDGRITRAEFAVARKRWQDTERRQATAIEE